MVESLVCYHIGLYVSVTYQVSLRKKSYTIRFNRECSWLKYSYVGFISSHMTTQKLLIDHPCICTNCTWPMAMFTLTHLISCLTTRYMIHRYPHIMMYRGWCMLDIFCIYTPWYVLCNIRSCKNYIYYGLELDSATSLWIPVHYGFREAIVSSYFFYGFGCFNSIIASSLSSVFTSKHWLELDLCVDNWPCFLMQLRNYVEEFFLLDYWR